jgi:protein phosphatase-4 regulatory subunit 3
MTQRWEQLNEPPPPPPVIEAESSKAWSRAAEAQEEEYFNASDDEEIGPKPPAEVRPPIKRKRSTPVTPGGPPSKRAAKAAAAAAAAATTATVATVTVSSAPSLGLDYDDGSDSEGSSGGQSPRLAPKAEGGTGPPPITPPEELAEDLGDMAMKMRAKRQREEEEDEGFAGLLVKANALGGATGKPASAASATAAGAETTAEPTGEGGGASTPKKKERSTPLKDAGKRIRLSLGSMGIGKALGGGSGNGK